jgi:hypothetical protein
MPVRRFRTSSAQRPQRLNSGISKVVPAAATGWGVVRNRRVLGQSKSQGGAEHLDHIGTGLLLCDQSAVNGMSNREVTAYGPVVSLSLNSRFC